jgi:hypothetical protein
MTKIKIPDSVSSIGSNAFCLCSSLSKIELSKNIKSIGTKTFYGCNSLTSVDVPDSVKKINAGAFYGCTGLKEMTLPFAGDGTGYREGFTQSNGHTQVFGYIFGYVEDNSSTGGIFQYAEAPSNRSTIKYYYYIPSSLEKVTIRGGNLSTCTFRNCSNLKSITICDGVKSVGELAFSGCSSLQNITLPFVGTSAKTSSDTNQYPFGYIFGTTSYNGGTSTSQTYYGSSTSSTTTSTYYIPTSLKEVTITGGNILYGAFKNCNNITTIVLPNISSIGQYAFDGCSSLANVYYCGTAMPTVSTGNTPLTSATQYLYSENEPTVEGNFWHYDENGEIAIWPAYVPEKSAFEIAIEPKATAISTGSYTATISTAGEKVYYKITPTETKTYTISSSVNMMVQGARLYDSDGNVISAPSEDVSFSISKVLEAGKSYYLMVYISEGSGSKTGSIKFTVSAS